MILFIPVRKRGGMWAELRAHFTRWHALVFLCRFLDVYGDSLFGGGGANVLMFYGEQLGASDLVSFAAVGLFAVCVAIYCTIVANKMQDVWPPRGPFFSVALCKALSCITTLVVLGLAAIIPEPSIALVACAMTFNVLGAAAEAFDSLAFFLAITRLGAVVDGEEKGSPTPFTTALFLLDYVVMNAAFLGGRFTTAAMRALVTPLLGMAGFALGAVGVIAGSVVVVIAGVIHTHYEASRVLSSKRKTRKKKQEQPLLQKEEEEEEEEQEEEEEEEWVAAEFWPYALFSLAQLPLMQAFVQLDMALPDYMKRRYAPNGGVLYPLFQGINPFLILVLVPLLGQFMRWPFRLAPLVFAGATALLALSFVWLAMEQAEWFVVVGLAQFTLGEASAVPRIPPYIAKILLPPDKVGYYSSLLTLPRAFGNLAILLFSSFLLDTYCPAEGACSPVMWWWVGGVAFITPCALLFLYLRTANVPCCEATVAQREPRL
jgi:hypothetical protein